MTAKAKKAKKHPLCDICCLHMGGHDVSEEERSVDGQLLEDMRNRVHALLISSLRDNEILIIDRLFGLVSGCTATVEEVSKEFSVTRERIQQIEAKALEKIAKSVGVDRA
ncbi:hypothetical protein HY622_00670 [Candidatus Uhrbacteria bacterium]|nr:hypothetical protein [Candidatus Uhrbacteria bacterium]